MVMVCVIFQLAFVNVTDVGDTFPSLVFDDKRLNDTSAVGCEVSTTVKVAVPPDSVVVRPEIGVTVTPATSLSVITI